MTTTGALLRHCNAQEIQGMEKISPKSDSMQGLPTGKMVCVFISTEHNLIHVGFVRLGQLGASGGLVVVWTAQLY